MTLDQDVLSHDEIRTLLSSCDDSFVGVRNATLIVLLWRCGLRISEALAVETKDVDLSTRTLTVQRGKGGKRRVIGLDSATAELLGRWNASRAAAGVTEDAPVFCTRHGGAIDPSYVRRLLPRLARRAAIGKRVHAHGFRHRFAIDLVDEGAPITTIRDALGHSSIAVTDTYLRRVGAGEAIDFGRAREWSLT